MSGVRRTKLTVLGSAAAHDVAGALCRDGADPAARREAERSWVFPARMPGGRVQPQLKVLQSNVCQFDCAYCSQRAGRDVRRQSFAPEELARLFDDLHRARKVRGLFLSSGVAGRSITAMDRMLATVEILRRRYRFRGFVHLKILPGAERSQVAQAARLADRLSINLEAPTAAALGELSGRKDLHGDLLARARWIAAEVGRRPGGARSHTTQFVVGAAGETDRQILTAAGRLYAELGLARAYYSGFTPVGETPLDGRSPTPAWREHRLYQADVLLRAYGYAPVEIPLDAAGNLDRARDPKQHWADRHPERFPLEVNTAEREELLRVPGLGPLGVARVLAARREGRLREPADLVRLGVRRTAAPYLLLAGRRWPAQLALPLSLTGRRAQG